MTAEQTKTAIIAVSIILLAVAIAYDNRQYWQKKKEVKPLYVPVGGLVGQICYIGKLIKRAEKPEDFERIEAGILHLALFFHDDPEIHETCLGLQKLSWDKEMELLLTSLNEPQQA